jgi:hypothetical protein
MTHQSGDNGQLAEPERMAIFAAVVQAQDNSLGIRESRQFVAKQFGVSVDEVRRIESEGLDNDWPPLG